MIFVSFMSLSIIWAGFLTPPLHFSCAVITLELKAMTIPLGQGEDAVGGAAQNHDPFIRIQHEDTYALC